MSKNFNVAAASFVTGIPLSLDAGWLVMAMDDIAAQEIDHSAILKFDRGLFEPICLKMFRSKHVAWLPGRREVVFIGANGECTSISSNGLDHDEKVTTSARNPGNTGDVRAATSIGDEIIVVGMQRQVYRRLGPNSWIDMMQGIPLADPAVTTGFECVLAISPTEVYAAGWNGELWLFDGTSWHQLGSPTNGVITALCFNWNGEVVGCGRNGLLIAGRNDQWRIMDEVDCPDDLWSLASASEKLFAAGLRHMFTITATEVKQTDLGDCTARTFGKLVSTGEVIWSFGEKDFLSFDGKKWTQFV
jgi:hypothetical protein